MKAHYSLLILFLFSFIILFSFSIGIEDFVNIDAMIYGEEAKNILRGKSYFSIGWITKPLDHLRDFDEIPYTTDWSVSPLYALVIAFFYSFFGVSFDSMKYAGVLFGSLSILATYFLAHQFLNKKMSLLASFLMITYPFFIYNSIVPGNEVFTSFFVTITLYFTLLKVTKKNLIMRGIFSGFAFLARNEVGFLLLIASLLAYSIKTHNSSFVRRVKDIGLILASFVIALSILFFHNNFFHYFIHIPNMVGKTLFGIELNLHTLPLISHLLVFIATIFILLLFFCFLSNAIHSFQKLAQNVESNKEKSILLITMILLILIISNNFNFQRIYDHSPILCILGLIGITINLKEVKKFNPLYTFLLLSVSTYTIFASDFSAMAQARYTIMSLPVLAVFATSATSKIISQFSRSKLSKIAILVLISSIVLLSSLPNYGILTQSIVIKGPFKIKNWDEACHWITNNTDENETVIATWPSILFYANRRSITLRPKLQYNNSELLSVIYYGQVSYIVICLDMRNMITNPLIADLYDYPRDVEGFQLMYQIEKPRLVIYKII